MLWIKLACIASQNLNSIHYLSAWRISVIPNYRSWSFPRHFAVSVLLSTSYIKTNFNQTLFGWLTGLGCSWASSALSLAAGGSHLSDWIRREFPKVLLPSYDPMISFCSKRELRCYWSTFRIVDQILNSRWWGSLPLWWTAWWRSCDDGVGDVLWDVVSFTEVELLAQI